MTGPAGNSGELASRWYATSNWTWRKPSFRTSRLPHSLLSSHAAFGRTRASVGKNDLRGPARSETASQLTFKLFAIPERFAAWLGLTVAEGKHEQEQVKAEGSKLFLSLFLDDLWTGCHRERCGTATLKHSGGVVATVLEPAEGPDCFERFVMSDPGDLCYVLEGLFSRGTFWDDDFFFVPSRRSVMVHFFHLVR